MLYNIGIRQTLSVNIKHNHRGCLINRYIFRQPKNSDSKQSL